MALAQLAQAATAHERIGSIGSAAVFYDSRNKRVKGFSTTPQRAMGSLGLMFEQLADMERRNPLSTRTTVRAFVAQGLVEGLRRRGKLDYDIEAVVEAGNAFPGYSMVYFGRNNGWRKQDLVVAATERENLNLISRAAPLEPGAALGRIAEAGYAITRLRDPDGADITQLLRLYREAYQLYTFEINEVTIRDMLGNGNIVLVGRNRDGAIASSLIAEHCVLELEGMGPVHIYELSDYATFPADRSHGLITAMQIEVAGILRSMPGGLASVVYAEDRAAWKAVNISSVKAGMTYCGTLPLHCMLMSDRDSGLQGEFENLNVFAVR